MNISIASYSFHGLLQSGQMDIFTYLEAVKFRYRLNAADIWNGTLGFRTDEDYIRKVRQALDEKEMTVANLCIDKAHVWDDDPAVRENNYKAALAWLRAAELLGAKTMRVDMGGKEQPITAEQLDYVAKRYSEYVRRGAEFGCRVGPETHWGMSLVKDNMEKVYRAVNHPSYGILLHIGHWVAGEEEAGDAMAAPWAFHTHVSAKVTRSCLEAKMRLLLDAGYQGHWGVEHHSGHNEHAEVAYQLAEVRRTLTAIKNPPPPNKK